MSKRKEFIREEKSTRNNLSERKLVKLLICQEEKSWLCKEELGIESFVKKEKVYQKEYKSQFLKKRIWYVKKRRDCL